MNLSVAKVSAPAILHAKRGTEDYIGRKIKFTSIRYAFVAGVKFSATSSDSFVCLLPKKIC